MREEQECSVLCVTVRVLCACVIVTQLCPTLGDPMDYSFPGSLCPWDSPGKNTGAGCHFFFRRSSQLRDPELQADSLPSEPPGKPLSECVCGWVCVCVYALVYNPGRHSAYGCVCS